MKRHLSVSRSKSLTKKFRKSVVKLKPEIICKYGDIAYNKFLIIAENEYDKLLSELPDIGRKNPFSMFFLPAVKYLAYYKTVCNFDSDLKFTIASINSICENDIKSIPRFLRIVISIIWFSNWFQRQIIKNSKLFKKIDNPYGYQLTYVKGEPGVFDYGVDYTECAICKYLVKYNAVVIGPNICFTDKIASELFGWGLTRTTTLAEGRKCCDFRFTKKGHTKVAYPKE